MLEPVVITRVVSTSIAMDGFAPPKDAIVLRTSPDEALVVGAAPDAVVVADTDAIITADAGWHGTWLSAAQADLLLAHGADWVPDPSRPTFAQGMLLQLPVKLWLEDDRALLLAPHTVAADLAARMERFL